jgi:dipeptidyl-peptidase-3
LAVRDIVLSKKKPRRVFVQPYTYVENGQVKAEYFEASPEGLIASFVKRFPASV